MYAVLSFDHEIFDEIMVGQGDSFQECAFELASHPVYKWHEVIVFCFQQDGDIRRVQTDIKTILATYLNDCLAIYY